MLCGLASGLGAGRPVGSGETPPFPAEAPPPPVVTAPPMPARAPPTPPVPPEGGLQGKETAAPGGVITTYRTGVEKTGP